MVHTLKHIALDVRYHRYNKWLHGGYSILLIIVLLYRVNNSDVIGTVIISTIVVICLLLNPFTGRADIVTTLYKDELTLNEIKKLESIDLNQSSNKDIVQDNIILLTTITGLLDTTCITMASTYELFKDGNSESDGLYSSISKSVKDLRTWYKTYRWFITHTTNLNTHEANTSLLKLSLKLSKISIDACNLNDKLVREIENGNR